MNCTHRLRLSVQPKSCSACTKATTRACPSASSELAFIKTPMRRTEPDCCAFANVADAEPAKKKQESGKKHQHRNGHTLLGAKLRQNGRHQIDTAGQATVSAQVSNGKVTGMSAGHPQKGNLPARKVKSQQK